MDNPAATQARDVHRYRVCPLSFPFYAMVHLGGNALTLFDLPARTRTPGR